MQNDVIRFAVDVDFSRAEDLFIYKVLHMIQEASKQKVVMM